MTDRQFNLIVRENLRAAADHIRRGHTGRWRQCADVLCRDAQNFVPPLETLLGDLQPPRSFVEAAAAPFARDPGETLPN
jgi:hypothetical protein